MTSACARCWMSVAKAVSISCALLAPTTWSSSPSLRAAFCASCVSSSAFGLAGFTSRSMTPALGTASRIICSLIAPVAVVRKPHAGHIAIWSAEASDEPELDRIAADAKDNRDRRGRRLDHHRRNVVARVDHGHWLADEIGGQRYQAVILVFSVLVVDRDVAALDKAYAAKALAKPSLHLRGSRTRAAAQIPHHRHRGLLCARRARPRRRAAEQR